MKVILLLRTLEWSTAGEAENATSACPIYCSLRPPRNTLCRFAAMLQNKTYLAEHFWALPSLARATSRELDLHRRKIFVNLNFKL